MMRWCLLLIAISLGGCNRGSAPATPTVSLTGELPLEAPRIVRAGEDLTIRVGPFDEADGAVIELVMLGGLSTQLYQATVTDDYASFELGEAATRWSGHWTLIAHSGEAEGRASLRIEPAESVSPMTVLVGPRSVPLDGESQAMVVALPEDSYGNPLLNAQTGRLQITYPDGQVEEAILPVRNGVGRAWVPGGSVSGRINLGVGIGEAVGAETVLEAVAGLPNAIEVLAEPAESLADGSTLIELRTQPMRDAFGNLLVDGSLVTFRVEIPGEEPRNLPAYTLDGVARVPLQAPGRAAIAEVRASVYTITSEPIEVHFINSVIAEGFNLRAIVLPEESAILLVTSPIQDQRGQLVRDGTLVDFTLRDSRGRLQQLQGVTTGGRATVEIRMLTLQVGDYTASAVIGDAAASTTFSVR